MYSKLEIQILLRLSFGLLGFCLAGGVATAECLLDSRIIDVTRQDGEPRQTVRLVRVHRGQHVMHEKTNETATQMMKWDCRQVVDGDSTSCSAEYEAHVGTLRSHTSGQRQ